MLTAIIVENDEQASDFLLNMIKSYHPEINVLDVARSVSNGIKTIVKHSPDLLFLDIELNDGSGFDLLKKFDTPSFETIFTTAHNTYYKEAFDHFAFAYLLKPFSRELLNEKLSYLFKTKRNFESSFTYLDNFINDFDAKIFIDTGKNNYLIKLKNIIHCTSEGNYTRFFLENDVIYLVNNTLKYYTQLLANKGFLRVNRFNLININHIVKIHRQRTITLSNLYKVEASVRNKADLVALINTLK